MEPLPALPQQPIPEDLVKQIAMDIGKETAAYIEVMYPDAVTAASSTFLLSVRNHVYNEIMASLKTQNADDIMKRLEERKVFRHKWRKQYRDIRRK